MVRRSGIVSRPPDFSTSGALRYYVTIKQPTAPTDGTTTPTWTNLATSVPVQRIRVGGGERVAGDRVQATPRQLVRFRYRGDVTETMRIVFGVGDVVEIAHVGDPDGLQMWEVADVTKVEST